MNSLLKLDNGRRRLYYEQGEARLGLSATSLEKDFWVCYILKELFSLSQWGSRLTFKGGTSLSKGWKLISRFSEDIDIVIDRECLGFGGSLSNKRTKKLVEKCSRCVTSNLFPSFDNHLRKIIPDQIVFTLQVADRDTDPDQQTLLFSYPSLFQGDITYLKPVVKIELGARSETEPMIHP